MPNWLTSLDLNTINWLTTQVHGTFLDPIMTVISALGNAGLIWIILSIVLLCVKKYRRAGICCLLALVLMLIFNNLLLKPLVARPRPFTELVGVIPLITPPTDYSFPSGHACASFAAATALLLTMQKKLALPALLLAVAISFSRVYLLVHYVSDVLAGCLLGILLGFAAYGLIRLGEKHRHRPPQVGRYQGLIK